MPEAIINYIALLGWSLDDETEFFHMDDLIKHFSLKGVSKSAASFDPQKLIAFQEKHMKTKTIEEKCKLCLPFLEKAFGDIPNLFLRINNTNILEAVLRAAGD